MNDISGTPSKQRCCDFSGKPTFVLHNLPGRFIVDLLKKSDIPEDVLNYFRKQGSKGGKARATKYSKEQLSEMGKKGGRPKGSGAKKMNQTKKGGK